jgi:hypothetical protein
MADGMSYLKVRGWRGRERMRRKNDYSYYTISV